MGNNETLNDRGGLGGEEGEAQEEEGEEKRGGAKKTRGRSKKGNQRHGFAKDKSKRLLNAEEHFKVQLWTTGDTQVL